MTIQVGLGDTVVVTGLAKILFDAWQKEKKMLRLVLVQLLHMLCVYMLMN